MSFYSQESREYLTQCTCSDYIKKAQNRIAEEQVRCTAYLSPSTHLKLRSVIETELITAHAKTLVEMETSGCAYVRIDMLILYNNNSIAQHYHTNNNQSIKFNP